MAFLFVASASVRSSVARSGRERFYFVLQHREDVLGRRQGSLPTCIILLVSEAAPLLVPSFVEEDNDMLGQQQS